MEKFYKYLSSLYRFMIVGMILYFDIKETSGFSSDKLYMYVILGLYTVAFALFKTNKWMAYGEFLVLVGFLYFFPTEITMYCLLFLPFIHFASSQVSKIDLIIFSGMFGFLLYTRIDNLILLAILAVSFFVSLSIFHFRFNQIEVLETRLFEERKKNQEVRRQLSNRNMEAEESERMMVRSKVLGEAMKVPDLIDILPDSARFFFDAHYACLYLKNYKLNQFVKKNEVGSDEKFDSPQVLDETEIQTDMLDGEMMQVIIYVEKNMHQKEPWGILRVYGKRATISQRNQRAFLTFSERDYELLLTYTMQASNKLKELLLSEKNEFLANYDFLTSVPNRRYFLERFDQYAAMAERGMDDFSLLLLDIDHFKKFNDNYGHDVGDSVLKIVAETLSETVRKKIDIVGRVGGEEFGILLFKPQNSAAEVAERIRKEVRKVPSQEPITLSVGITRYGQDGKTWEDLYNNADQALYYAKKNGRDQVVEYSKIPKEET